MVMKGSTVMIIMFMLTMILFMPPALAQNTSLSIKGSITVISGDYSSGSIIITNSGNLAYDLVTFQDFRVVDERGNEVSGFSFTMDRTNFIGWKIGRSYVINYNISAGRNVPEGSYSLLLRFRALASGGGRLYILRARVPVRVIKNPLQFGKLSMYVKGREEYTHPFTGDTLVVYSHVQNLAHFNVKVTAGAYLEKDGKHYLGQSREVILNPGDNTIRFEISIPTDFPEGTYALVYTIKYPGGEKKFTQVIKVGIGVNIINLSTKSSEVFLSENNVAYLTLIADRDIPLRIEIKATAGEKEIYRVNRTFQVKKGTRVITLELPTNVSGNIRANISVYYGKLLLKNFHTEYRVVAYPVLSKITYRKTGPDSVEIILNIINDNAEAVPGNLYYEMYAEGKTLYKKSMKITIPPGALTMKLNFKVPVGKKVYYRFSLSAIGKQTVKEGSLLLKPPSTHSSTSTSTAMTKTESQSTTRITTTSSPEGGSRGLYAVIILVVFAIIAVGYYENVRSMPTRRTRPKPKRKSPLGRFKRPKMPKFRENKELPKK